MKRFLILLLMIFPSLVFAQANFKKGYRLTINGDTIRGYINYVEKSKSPVNFTFKNNLNANAEDYDLFNSEGFGITDYEEFKRYNIKVSLSKEDATNLTIGADTSFKRATVFLKILEKGKHLSLFSYSDQIKIRYYILEQNSKEPVELIKQMYYEKGTISKIITKQKYTGQLAHLANKYNPELNIVDKLDRLDYNEADLIKIVAPINGNAVKKSKYKSSRFFAGVGANANKVKYGVNSDIAVDKKLFNSTPLLLPYINAGIDIYLKPEIGRLLFRAELFLTYDKNEIDNNLSDGKVYQSHRFNQLNFNLSPQFIYNLYNTNKLKAFIGAGINLNYSAYSNNVYEKIQTLDNIVIRTQIDDPVLQNFYISPSVSAGITLNRRYQILVRYNFSTAITDYEFYAIKLSSFKIGFNYLFGK